MKKKPEINSTMESWSIEAFSQELSNISKNIENEDLLTQEEKKLALIQGFEAKLKKIATLEDEKSEKERQSDVPKSRSKKLLSKVFYYFLVLFGSLENASGNYLFGTFLFNLIPGISNPVLIATSLIYAGLSGILFYGFEIAMLKDSLGIPYTNSDVKKLIDIYSEQLKTLAAINDHISSLSMLKLDSKLYVEYIKFYMLLKEEQQKIYAMIGNYKESLFKKALKIFIIAFGALSTAAGSYFFMITALTAIAPALVGTPVGWLIISLTILAGLGFYYVMGGSGMARLANRDYYSFQDLKKELDTFNQDYSGDMELLTTLRSKFVERPTIDVAVQTDPQVDAPYQPAGLRFFLDFERDSDSVIFPASDNESGVSVSTRNNG